MRAAHVPAPGRIEVCNFPLPKPNTRQVLVKMHRASVCGSDVRVVFDGLHDVGGIGQPGYPGHEGVGSVVESHSSAFPPGMMVLTLPRWAVNMVGCFSEYQVFGEEQLLPLPLGGDPARLLMAQPLGATMFGMRRFWTGDGIGRVATVIGAGCAGLFFVQQLRRLNFGTVLVSDLNHQRLRTAAELGASVTVHAPSASIVAATMDITDGAGADLVIEAAGYDQCRTEAVESVRQGGTVGLYGHPERHGLTAFPDFLAWQKSVTAQWASCAQAEPGLRSFRNALAAIHERQIEVDYCLKSSFPLEELPEALQAAKQQGHGLAKLCIDISPATSPPRSGLGKPASPGEAS